MLRCGWWVDPVDTNDGGVGGAADANDCEDDGDDLRRGVTYLEDETPGG